MDEFNLIKTFFKSIESARDDVVFGIGDDAACLQVPAGMQLLVSCDTLVSGVHFLPDWDAYDIAYKAVMANVSDMAAMGASPSWITLALTLPEVNRPWLQRFSQGLSDSLTRFNIALVGGDTTRGPLSITLTIHGLVPKNKAVRRSGAKFGDKIYVSGELGAAAQAVDFLQQDIDKSDQAMLMDKLLRPTPRIDLTPLLLSFATAAIDVSDGLSADLHHICEASGVGACLVLDTIPLHSLVKKYQGSKAIDFALRGGDDYELCFTIPPANEKAFLAECVRLNLTCYAIGEIETELGLRGQLKTGEVVPLKIEGYSHF